MSGMDSGAFVAKFGSVYEHSSWVAEGVFKQAMPDGVEIGTLGEQELIRRFGSVFMAASQDQQLVTLQAHPQLACALDERQQLTDDSKAEQSGAGLDSCSVQEFEEFGRLNAAYSKKFGFPFIIAVTGLDKFQIIAAMQQRLDHSSDIEFATAIAEVEKIALIRLNALIDG